MIKFLKAGYRHLGTVKQAGEVATLTYEAESELVDRGIARLVSIRAPAALGPRTVIHGDSMSDWYHLVNNPTPSYNRTSRLLTIPYTAHRTPPNGTCVVWSYQYPSFSVMRSYPIVYIDINTLGVYVDSDHGRDLPEGVLSGTFFMRIKQRHMGTNGWINWLQMLSGYKLNIVNNGAQSGVTSILSRDQLSEQVLSYNPDLVIGTALGINDDSSDKGSLPLSVTLEALDDIYTRILDSGARLLIHNISPTKSPDSRAVLPTMRRAQEKNKWLEYFAKGRQNMVLLDSWSRMVDPTDANGLCKAAWLRDSDGVHRSVYASVQAAQDALPIINAWYPGSSSMTLPCNVSQAYLNSLVTTPVLSAVSGVVTVNAVAHGWRVGEEFRTRSWSPASANGVWRVATVIDADNFTYNTGVAALNGSITGASGKVGNSRQLFPDPLLLITTGGSLTSGVTGVVAGKLSCGAQGTPAGLTAVASVVARADGFGNDQRIRVSAAAADDRPQIKFLGSTVLGSELLPGRFYDTECQLTLRCADWSLCPISEIVFQINITVDGIAYITSAIETYDTTNPTTKITFPTGSDTYVLHLKADAIQLPISYSSITKAEFICYVRAADTFGGTMDMDLGRIAWTDVTPDGIY